MNYKLLSVAICLLLSSTLVSAKGEDLEACLFNNGIAMPEKVCKQLRGVAAREAKQKAIDDAKLADYRAREAERIEASKRSEAAYAAAQLESAAKRQQEQDDRQARHDKERSAQARADAMQTKVANEKIASLKSECGSDYKALRIGMSIHRAQQCVGGLKLTGQVNRVDGVVSTYQGAGVYAYVIDEKIVGWGR